MALQRDTYYPGRYSTGDAAHPQGAFKNRTTPTSQDGSYLEQDWLNDWDGFFASLLDEAGITPDDSIDEVGASQYYDAMKVNFIARSDMSNFRAYQSSGQSISASVTTKLTFTTENYDDTSEYDATTSRFTAINDGTYIFSAGYHQLTSTISRRTITLYVNGSEYTRLHEDDTRANNTVVAGSTIVKLSAGDYVEVYYTTTNADTGTAVSALSYFAGLRVK